MKVIYFDCFAGISGDMTIGALLDLGVDKDYLISELNKLNLDGYSIEVNRANKNGIGGTDFNVILKHHDHHHEESSNHNNHHHRSLTDINEIIDNSCLNIQIKEISKNILIKVAEAESKVHGKPLEEVHFHEVGAIDSIIDIVGCAICINYIKPDKIICSPVHIGTGFVNCQHGLIPVPAPATLEIISKHNIPTYCKGIKNELVTPTGAAIIAYLADEFSQCPDMVIHKAGYGAGKRDLEIPNLLRIIEGKVKKN